MLNNPSIKTVEGTTRKTILVDELNSTAFSCKVANTGVDADDDGKKIVKAGTPIYGSLEARENPYVVAGGSIDPVANASVTGTGITAAEVTAATFSTEVSGESGTYEFVYDADAQSGTPDPSWKLNGSKVDIADYGIEVTGSAADGDKISVVFTAGGTVDATGILLHDVDVTGGTQNAQVVVFGFIDLTKLDEDVQALITADVKSALKMIQFVK
jgi:hypothetical protein